MKLGLVFSGCHKRGGVERSVWEMAHALQERHAVTVVARDIDTSGLGSVEAVTVTARGNPAAFALGARRALQGRHFDHLVSFGVGDVGADVLWVNSVHRAWLQASATFAHEGLRDPRLRYVMPRHQQLLAMERRYFTRPTTHSVVVVADQVGRDLSRLYGVPSAKLTTVHNGYAPTEFSPSLRLSARADARAEHGYGEDDVVLLMAANELERKGFRVSLQAIAALGDPRVRLLLVGRASPAAYQPLIDELGLRAAVRYAGSVNMASAHAAADLFLLPTQYEAFCLAIVEALASGLPVITSRVPGASDLMTSNVNGLTLADPTSVAELTEALRIALVRETRDRWSAAAASTVADYSWDQLFARAEASVLC